MAAQPLILALANPEPEIRPELARAARPDCIVATGRSDYPNQVNNVLCFPYIFRGALDCGATKITEAMKLAVRARDRRAGQGRDQRRGGRRLRRPGAAVRRRLHHSDAVRLAADPAHRAGGGQGGAPSPGVATRPIADLDAYRQSLTRFVYQTGMLMRPLFAAAKAKPVRVVYAEGEDERVLRAVQVVLDEGLARADPRRPAGGREDAHRARRRCA